VAINQPLKECTLNHILDFLHTVCTQCYAILTPKGQMSSELTFESSGRLLNAQIGLDRIKLFGVGSEMTPLRGGEFFFILTIFLYNIGAQRGRAAWAAQYHGAGGCWWSAA
jgi:hypothetical protein